MLNILKEQIKDKNVLILGIMDGKDIPLCTGFWKWADFPPSP